MHDTEENMLDDSPRQYSIFKKKSAMRMQLERPKEKYKVGCVFLQVAPSKTGNGLDGGYAWEEKKISVKLGINDLSKVLYSLTYGGECSLFHQYNGESKSIVLKPKDGGGYFLSINHSGNEIKNNVSVPLDGEECIAIRELIGFAIGAIHNWI